MKHGKPFTGDSLRGQEFKEILADLQAIRNQESSPAQSPTPTSIPSLAENVSVLAESVNEASLVNIPLKDQGKTKGLVNLWEDLVTDPADMPRSKRNGRSGFAMATTGGLIRTRDLQFKVTLYLQVHRAVQTVLTAQKRNAPTNTATSKASTKGSNSTEHSQNACKIAN